MPANFSRYKRGDQLIAQELNKLLALDAEYHPHRPLLTEDGRVRLKDPASGAVVIGQKWSDILARAPQYFSVKHAKARGEAYGRACHADLVRIAKQLAGPHHVRTVFWHFGLFFSDFSGIEKNALRFFVPVQTATIP